VEDDSAQATSPGISAVAGEGDLRVLGYLPDSQSLHVAGMYADVCSPSLRDRDVTDIVKASSTSDDWQDALSAEMESALRTLPPKPYIGTRSRNCSYRYG